MTQLETIIKSNDSLAESLGSCWFDFYRLTYHGDAILANHSQTSKTYNYDNGEHEAVIIDWRRCLDDSWRRLNSDAFRIRVANHARGLKNDLWPSDIRVLQCIGYLDVNNITVRYIFRQPDNAIPGKEPTSIHDPLKQVQNSADIPGSGGTLSLPKAVASTIFECYNIT